MSETRELRYTVALRWTGNAGEGTATYHGYSRDHVVGGGDKPLIAGSTDPHFYGGDNARWNPEELLVASVSACHQLWYLHLCAEAGVVVTSYEDNPEGVMVEQADGGGEFTRLILHPRVTIRTGGNVGLAHDLHERAHALCFIARSLNFPVTYEAAIEAK
jgi:organic hydroperoxide reductase OsmC/OhrA